MPCLTCQMYRSLSKTSYPGRAPQIVEKPSHLSTYHHHAVRTGAKKPCVVFFTVRGFVCVCHFFEDGTDLYWARSRVLEYLNQVQGKTACRCEF
uniref:Cobalt-zinc-cadmium resistance protein CzcA n=1 Tax=Klebsiella pneumoniae TaxID=573 RepID=A0A8B0SW34_KLEPN|nr:Cobalt-zinc-cadmium resistance protein CzcA [Klebsiella pneumoniae]